MKTRRIEMKILAAAVVLLATISLQVHAEIVTLDFTGRPLTFDWTPYELESRRQTWKEDGFTIRVIPGAFDYWDPSEPLHGSPHQMNILPNAGDHCGGGEKLNWDNHPFCGALHPSEFTDLVTLEITHDSGASFDLLSVHVIDSWQDWNGSNGAYACTNDGYSYPVGLIHEFTGFTDITSVTVMALSWNPTIIDDIVLDLHLDEVSGPMIGTFIDEVFDPNHGDTDGWTGFLNLGATTSTTLESLNAGLSAKKVYGTAITPGDYEFIMDVSAVEAPDGSAIYDSFVPNFMMTGLSPDTADTSDTDLTDGALWTFQFTVEEGDAIVGQQLEIVFEIPPELLTTDFASLKLYEMHQFTGNYSPAPEPASPAEITVGFTGQVSAIDGQVDLSGTFNTSQAISGSFTYDGTVADSSPYVNVGEFNGAVTGLSIDIGGYAASLATPSNYNYIMNTNAPASPSANDEMIVSAGLAGSSVSGADLTGIYFQMFDAQRVVFADNAAAKSLTPTYDFEEFETSIMSMYFEEPDYTGPGDAPGARITGQLANFEVISARYTHDLGALGPMSSFDPVAQEPMLSIVSFPFCKTDAHRIEVMFEDDKYLLIEPDSYFDDEDGQVDAAVLMMNLKEFGGPAGGGNFVADVTIGLLDANGAEIFSQTEVDKVIFSYSGSAYTDVPTPLVACGMFVDFGPGVGPLDPAATVDFNLSGNLTVECLDSDGDGVCDVDDVLNGCNDNANLYVDSIINLPDFAVLAADFGCTSGCAGDVDSDDDTDLADLAILAANWLCTGI